MNPKMKILVLTLLRCRGSALHTMAFFDLLNGRSKICRNLLSLLSCLYSLKQAHCREARWALTVVMKIRVWVEGVSIWCCCQQCFRMESGVLNMLAHYIASYGQKWFESTWFHIWEDFVCVSLWGNTSWEMLFSYDLQMASHTRKHQTKNFASASNAPRVIAVVKSIDAHRSLVHDSI